MASKENVPTIVWQPGEINEVIACIADAQNAIAHFQRLFAKTGEQADYFPAKEVALVAAMVRRWADWQPKGNIDLKALANKIDNPDGGGGGDGGKNIPDSPR